MGARHISNAEWFEKHMQQLHAELEMLKKKRQRDRREHRLAWRRRYHQKKRDEGQLETP